MVPASRVSHSVRVNALRGVAALSVVVYHVLLQARAQHAPAFGLPALDGVISRNLDRLGGWGVSVFLVLSGFGLVRSFARSISLRRFAVRRAVRIYPMFWWIAAPTIVLAALFGAMHANEVWKLPFWLCGLNFVSPRLFTPLPGAAPQWWYVGLALQVYAVFPLVWLILRRAGLVALILSTLFINSASLLAIGQLPLAWQYLQMGFVGARLMEVVSGVFLFAILRGSPARPATTRGLMLSWALLAGSFVALALLQPAERVHWLFELSVVGFVALVLWTPAPRRSRLRPVRAAADWTGMVSYPLYLCHYAVIALVLAALKWAGWFSTPLLLLLGVALSLAVAAGFFYSLVLAWAARSTRAEHVGQSGAIGDP